VAGTRFASVLVPRQQPRFHLCCGREPGNDINNSNQRLIMAGPIEMLIVAGVFGIIGTYLYIVHRFIRSGEEPAAKQGRAHKRISKENPPTSKLTIVNSH